MQNPFKFVADESIPMSVMFSKPNPGGGRTGGKKCNKVYVSTQKSDKTHRLCIALPFTFMDEARLRVGDCFQIGFKDEVLYLKPDANGFKLNIAKTSPKPRLYTTLKPEWNIPIGYQATLVSWKIMADGIIAIKLQDIR